MPTACHRLGCYEFVNANSLPSAWYLRICECQQLAIGLVFKKRKNEKTHHVRILVPQTYINVKITINSYNYNLNRGINHHHNNNYPCGRPKGRIVLISWTRSKFNKKYQNISKTYFEKLLF